MSGSSFVQSTASPGGSYPNGVTLAYHCSRCRASAVWPRQVSSMSVYMTGCGQIGESSWASYLPPGL
jgi:hypothetical protein